MTNNDSDIERVYKEHSAPILATLVRLFGTRNFEMAEDVLHEAFRKALVAWREQGLPENPAAWLQTAAKRQAIDVIRSHRTQRKFSQDLSQHLESGWTLTHTVEQEFDDSRIVDHQLRMIFMCANVDLPPENQVPLMLRTLCGFGIPAIARALLLPEETVKKRLVRSREHLRGHAFEFPDAEKLPAVMDSVHTTIYLLFNEGFHSVEETHAMNLELCREAVHLAFTLASEPRVANRDTLGLLALLQLHMARTSSKVDDRGLDVPLDLQDRSRWDADNIRAAKSWLQLANVVSAGASDRFFIEAKIAEQHCSAPTFAETNWPLIVEWYDALVGATHSPVAELNRAIAVAYAGRTRDAMALIERARSHPLLRTSHLPEAALAHLAARSGDVARARQHAEEALRLGASAREHRAMMAQLERLWSNASTFDSTAAPTRS